MLAASAVGEPSRLDEATIVAALRSRPLVPYEEIEATPRLTGENPQVEIEAYLANGWKAATGFFSFATPYNWKHENRSFAAHVHALEPIAALLIAHSLTAESRYLDIATSIALAWADRFLAAHGDSEAALAWIAEKGLGDGPWYDMSIALRCYRLAYILDALAHEPSPDPAVIRRLFEAVILHFRVLELPGVFKNDYNHGFYQALAGLAAASRLGTFPSIAEIQNVYRQRFSAMLEQQFTASGIHREHSPGYHLMTLRSVASACALGLITDPSVTALRERAEEAATWMVDHEGILLAFGDTDPQRVAVPSRLAARLTNAALRRQMDAKAPPAPLPHGLLALLDAGYAFYRAPGCYFAQMSAFHSRIHKHADHGTFVWSDVGRAILIDPGRFGYGARIDPKSPLASQGFNYGDPRRIYVELSRAHNVVEFDGHDHDRATIAPFQSALKNARIIGDGVSTFSEIPHANGILQRRIIALRPGRFLLLLDEIDSRTGSHDYAQWFQLAPRYRLAGSTQTTLSMSHESDGQPLTIAMLSAPGPQTFKHYRGVSEPRMCGWYSPAASRLAPTTSVAIVGRAEKGVIATVITISAAVEVLPAPSPRDGLYRWQDAHGTWRVALDANGEIRLLDGHET